MSPETLRDQFRQIILDEFIKNDSRKQVHNSVEEVTLSLSEEQMFRLWNMLGEELGIDLSLATPEQRSMLFEACKNGKHLNPKSFGALLWLVYYSRPTYLL